jgi:hypothetical protein
MLLSLRHTLTVRSVQKHNLDWCHFFLVRYCFFKVCSQIASIRGNHLMHMEPEKAPCCALIVKSFLEYPVVQANSSAPIGSYALLKAVSFMWKTKTHSTAS